MLLRISNAHERYFYKQKRISLRLKLERSFLFADKSAFVGTLRATTRLPPEYLQLLRDVADEEEVSASLPQQTLKTTFMLWLVHRPPMRL